MSTLADFILYAPPVHATTPVYFCPRCRTAYSCSEAATACALHPGPEKQTSLRPGNFVVIDEGYMWSDDKQWIAGPSERDHHGRRGHTFYFIVTAVTDYVEEHDMPDTWFDNRSYHRARIHVATGGANIADEGETKGFRIAYTSADSIRMAHADERSIPEAVKIAARRMIGKTSALPL